jgi:S-(hydroxymethyl)glutathione dehydrogenase / alcohol dehydrogenase
MDVRAAVAVAAGRPLEITTVQLEGPREGEVLVEIKATGVCHTDEFTLSGADPEGRGSGFLGHGSLGGCWALVTVNLDRPRRVR